ncbi:MAG TPA: DUF4399 domain-containing protein [Candidatus Limnocylindrales bacterium]|nr:DUF4399 domain-containing protein [Candidatus Limnocylindrales bacterium]
MNRRSPRFAGLSSVLLLVALGSVACGGGASPTTAPATSPGASIVSSFGPRPSSPAVVTIVEPTNGAQLSGPTVHVVLTLTGATIVPATTTSISPTTGHIHLYVDNNLVSMNYGLTQDIPVSPGTYVLKAEFVAADHAPFNPRVYSAEVFFTVK